VRAPPPADSLDLVLSSLPRLFSLVFYSLEIGAADKVRHAADVPREQQPSAPVFRVDVAPGRAAARFPLLLGESISPHWRELRVGSLPLPSPP